MENFDLRKYLAENKLIKEAKFFDGKKIGFENIINMVVKDMDAEGLGVEDGDEYLDKMIKRLEEMKINPKNYFKQ
jgi:hypothetical protein